MFTGIVTGIGHIVSIVDAGDRTFRIGCDWDCSEIDIGTSIACSGAVSYTHLTLPTTQWV